MELKRHEPLYLKHRPQTLEQLVGQTAVLTTLSNAINHDRISHAYLFTGPRGTGKTSSARILAKSLNCTAFEKETVKPCLECTSCLEIANCNSPAVIEIDAASHNSVDDARLLIERAPLVAPGARHKIYIIDECHMLTKEAFNALLKTIEDPPPNVVFILATTEEHKVIPTIVSRCQRLMFRLVTQDDLIQHLRNVATSEQIEITDRALDFVARRSGGGMRDALGLLDQASLLSAPGQPVDVSDLLSLLGALHEDVLLDMSAHILNRSGHELLTAAGKLLHDGREPAIVVQELTRHFLNLAKASYLYDSPNRDASATSLIIGSPGYLEGLWVQAPKFERSELSQLVEALNQLEQACRRTTQPAMQLEVGLLSLCHRQDMLLIRELADRVARLECGAPPTVAARVVETPRPLETPRPVAAPVVETPPVVEAPRPVETPPVVEAPRPVETPPVVEAPRPVETPPAATTDDGYPPDEVDRIWSAALDELQRKNIPAFSIVSQHAFPLSLTDRDFVLGVRENLLKSVEAKAEHLKAACAAALGKPINVKLKPTAAPLAPTAVTIAKAAPTMREERTPAPAPVAAGPSDMGGDDYEEPELAPRARLDNEPPSLTPTPAATAAPRGNDSTIVKEAYKLFEGPGSRQIG